MRSLHTIPDPNADARFDAYELRTIGERAAKIFLSRGSGMNDAVAEAIKKNGGKMNNHHIQRVVEYANLRAFRELRPSSKGQPVTFDGGPASAAAVIMKLRGGVVKEAAMLESKEPGGTSGLLWRTANLLEDRMEKAASSRSPVIDRDEEVNAVDLYLKLGQAAEQCKVRAAVLEEKCASQLHEVMRHSALALNKGATLGDVSRVIHAAAMNHPEMSKVAMDTLLSKVCPRFGLIGEVADESMEKTSSATPNPDHPIYSAMAEYVKLAEELQVKKGATRMLLDHRVRLHGVIGQNHKLVPLQ